MRVILLENIPGLGRGGDLKTVSDGYARNYLLPKKLAILAIPQEIEKWKIRLAGEEKQKIEGFQQAKLLKEKIESLHLEKSLTAEGGEAFGSLRKENIIDFLRENGIELSKNAIELDRPIKKAGEYAVLISLHPEISATLKIAVLLSPRS